MDQHVHMFGHDDIRPQRESVPCLRECDRVGQPRPNSVIREELMVAVAREGQEVDMTGIVVDMTMHWSSLWLR